MDINILIGGKAGQGLNVLETLLTTLFHSKGYFVFSAKEIMSRIRGGINTVTVRISDSPKNGYKKNADLVITLNKLVQSLVKNRITLETKLVNEKDNLAAFGLICGLFNFNFEDVNEFLTKIFKEKRIESLESVKKGFEDSEKIKLNVNLSKKERKELFLLNGTKAVGLGALLGGCNFLSFYPMSPATGVAIFLANLQKETGIVVEQFEDEIAAICAAIGAWYAGARAFVTTSGGGFALMEEALSLSGMSETPVVIHLAQRPGPATGLPTRTAQSDLNLALYAGHGEFPRVIFSPATVEDSLYLTHRAFNIADKYQIPVIILTDQFLLDSFSQMEKIDISKFENEYYISRSFKDYKRYEITRNGISFRSIPGFGEGVVIANGNEHDEWGDISENEYLNKIMQEKRMKKYKLLEKDVVKPYFHGEDNYKYLVVSWGSTYHTVKEAIELLEDRSFAILHFTQVWPINDEVKKYFENAGKIIFIEENYTGQFADLLVKKFNLNNFEKILKYNGRAFFVEEVMERLEGYKAWVNLFQTDQVLKI